MYFIYSKDAKQYINTCIGYEELSKFMNRNINSIRQSIRKINLGITDKMKDSNGNCYTIITEDNFYGGKNEK